MHVNVAKELALMKRMTTPELRTRYAEVFGEATNANNRAWLVKRIAWRLQALAEGDLSERARLRAQELARDADIRLNPPRAVVGFADFASKTAVRTLPFETDRRLPAAGTVLTRHYKGEDLQVRVLADGFEFEGEVFNSLSAVARAITGSHCNGYHFFRDCLNASGGFDE